MPETLAIVTTAGALLFAAAAAAGAALIGARALGLDRAWLKLSRLPIDQRLRPANTLAFAGIAVGVASLGVLLGWWGGWVLDASWAATAFVAATLGSFLAIALSQAKNARDWAQRHQPSIAPAQTQTAASSRQAA